VLEVSRVEVVVHDDEPVGGSGIRQREGDAGRVVMGRHSETEIGALVIDSLATSFEMGRDHVTDRSTRVICGGHGPIEDELGGALSAHPGVAVDVHIDLTGGDGVVEGTQREGRVYPHMIPVARIGRGCERIIATVFDGGTNSFIPPPLGQREVTHGNDAGNTRVCCFPNLIQRHGVDSRLIVHLRVLESQVTVRVLIDVHLELVRGEHEIVHVGGGNRKKREEDQRR